MDLFDRAWKMSAEKSLCDAFGGMEYQRVRSAWDRYGHLGSALQFIVNSANEPAPAHATDGPQPQSPDDQPPT